MIRVNNEAVKKNKIIADIGVYILEGQTKINNTYLIW